MWETIKSEWLKILLIFFTTFVAPIYTYIKPLYLVWECTENTPDHLTYEFLYIREEPLPIVEFPFAITDAFKKDVMFDTNRVCDFYALSNVSLKGKVSNVSFFGTIKAPYDRSIIVTDLPKGHYRLILYFSKKNPPNFSLGEPLILQTNIQRGRLTFWHKLFIHPWLTAIIIFLVMSILVYRVNIVSILKRISHKKPI
jgi:hypothetical protein